MSQDIPKDVYAVVGRLAEAINGVFDRIKAPPTIRLDVSMSLAMTYFSAMWKADPELTKLNIQQAIHQLELMRDAKDADELDRIRLMLNSDATKGKVL